MSKNEKSKHSFSFRTRWEVIKDGKVIKSSDGYADEMKVEGKVNVIIKNKDGFPIYESEQEMKSFSVGFLEDMMNGRRIAQRNVGFETPPYIIGEGEAPTRVQQFAILKWFSEIPTSSQSPYVLESLSEASGCVRAVISTTKTILTGSGTIKEICLHDTGTYYNTTNIQYMNMMCRDKLVRPATFAVGDTVKVVFTIDFPTGNALMTKNWVQNFLQNIAPANYTFTQTDGETTGTGATNTGLTFTKAANCQAAADDDTMGLVIGTSAAQVDYNDTALGAQIAHGTGSGQMEYGIMPVLSSVAHIYPTLGKADITYSRDFINVSGDAINVNEAGLIAKTAVTTEGVNKEGEYLIAHWNTGNIIVDNGATLRIYFQPQISADPELTSGLEGVCVLDDAFRTLYPQLAYVSMRQVGYNSGKPWATQMEYAQNLNLAGFTDWRLPRQSRPATKEDPVPANELYGIYLAKEAGAFNPALSAPDNYYWSSTEYSAPGATTCRFSDGNVSGNLKTGNGYARCVR